MTRPLAPCGTEAAYHRHRARNETPCPSCCQAHSWYTSDRLHAAERRQVLAEANAYRRRKTAPP
jgi:hypothetical protein